MIPDNKDFDTNVLFSGGAGMFLQYHDIVKPAYLYAIIKMIATKETFGMPIEIIKDMSIHSLVEWYLNRRYKNPLQSLDYMHKLNSVDMDRLLYQILKNDPSIYKLSPGLNIQKMLSVYKKQHMTFPVYVYSEYEEPYIKEDIKSIFRGIKCRYLFGDLKECILKTDQNFTYIFSDIELTKQACEILHGRYAHVLQAGDYGYNYIDNGKTFKYDLKQLSMNHPFIRTSITVVSDPTELMCSFIKMRNNQGGE
jgi:hypothetical protein